MVAEALPVVRIHNKLVEAQATLTLLEQRVLLYICAHLISERDERFLEEYTIPIRHFRDVFSISNNDVYAELKSLGDTLMHRQLRIEEAEKQLSLIHI